METRIDTMPNRFTKRLGFEQALHLKAAECWLALGKIEEARQEMTKITHAHPDVSHVQKKIDAEIRYVRSLISDDVMLIPYWDSDSETRTE